MIVFATILQEIGDKTPIIRSYLGGGMGAGAVPLTLSLEIRDLSITYHLLPAVAKRAWDRLRFFNKTLEFDLRSMV